MYYYIFDIKKCKKRSVVADIKNHLAALGISGEYTYPSTAYTTEELIDLGISKKYNTIVGIGDDMIANAIASKLVGLPEAMGFIPIEASSDLCQLIGTSSWREAANNLRFRKIAEMKVGRLADGSVFLTSIELDLKNPTEITMELKDCMIQGKAANFQIANYNPLIRKIGEDWLDIVFQTVDPKESGFLSKISSMLGFGKEGQNDISLIRARSLRLFTSAQIPILAHGNVVAKTPQFIECSDENLRLIVGKKKI